MFFKAMTNANDPFASASVTTKYCSKHDSKQLKSFSFFPLFSGPLLFS